MGEKEGQDPLSEINWGEIREPYISNVTQNLAGVLGPQIGQPATPTSRTWRDESGQHSQELPFIAPMNPLQQNSADIMNRMMGYGNFQDPGRMGFGQAGGFIPEQPPPPNTPQPVHQPVRPTQPQPFYPNTPVPMVRPQPNMPAVQPGVQPLPNMPMNQPMPYPGFSPLRRR